MRYVFEFRDDTWFSEKVFNLLDEEKIGFCVHDMQGLYCPRRMAGGFMYVRLHGATALYDGNYSREQLEEWASFIRICGTRGDVFVYFNNDISGYAVKNAQELSGILSEQ